MSDRATDVETFSKNSAGATINPATEDKQDTLILNSNNSQNAEGGGKISVGTTAVEVTFTITPTKSILLSADINNTGTLYWGKSNVASDGSNACGTLEAGESIAIDYDDVSNPLYVVASIAAQNFFKGAIA